MNQSASEITVTPARDYGNEVGQGWPVVVAPAPGELLSSWLHRLAMANGIPPQYFGRVLDVAGADWSAKLDRSLPGRVLNLLVERTRLPAEDIDGLTLIRDPLTRLRMRQTTGSGDARASTARVNRLQYCPACLKEDCAPFFRRGWTIPTTLSRDEASALTATANVEIGQSLEIVSFSIRSGSGNALFDQSITDQITRLQQSDQHIPPPPEEVAEQYIGQTIAVRFHGRQAR